MLSPITHIIALTSIRRSRLLPRTGKVLVKTSHQVSASDTIAECRKVNPHHIIDLRRALGINTPEEVKEVMERQSGEKLQAGDVIARKSGLFSQVVRAPEDCSILAILGSRVLLEAQGDPFRLRAGITGVITEIYPDQGAEVETNGMLVQGVWGNDRAGVGLLLAVGHSPEDEFVLSKLDVSMRGSVVMAGFCQNEDVLLAANDLPLRGLILGSMSSHLIPVADKMNYPIVLLEGFGQIPMNQAAYKLLTSNEKRDASVNSARFNPITGERPEIIIPLPAQAAEPPSVGMLEAGKTVRLHCVPYGGQVGTIISIHASSVAFPSGVRAVAAEVRLENGRQVTVPLSNMDVLE